MEHAVTITVDIGDADLSESLAQVEAGEEWKAFGRR